MSPDVQVVQSHSCTYGIVVTPYEYKGTGDTICVFVLSELDGKWLGVGANHWRDGVSALIGYPNDETKEALNHALERV